MIESFQCKETEKIWRRLQSRKFPVEIQLRVLNKMQRIDAAEQLTDFRFPPSNRFEILKGKRQGQYSIRVNQQWRLCFEFDGHVQNLQLVDYH